MDASPQGIRPRARALGPVLAVAVAVALEGLSQEGFRVPNPPAILLLVVVLAASIDGVGAGLITALIAWLYFVYSFSIPGHPLQYTADDLRRVIVWGMTTPATSIMVGILRQRAEQAQGEKVQRDADRRYRELFDNAPVGLFRTTTDGRVLDANSALVAMLGFPDRDTLLATNIRDLCVDPRDRQRAVERIERAGRIDHVELQYRRRDGTPVWFEVSGRVVPDADGGIWHYEGAMLDVTERKREEEARQLLAEIVESTDDAIYRKTLDGVILNWNAAAERMYGYTRTEAVGRSVSMLAPPGHLDEIPKILARLARGERIEHYESVRVRKDGTRLEVSLTISPIRNKAGEVVGASTIVRDITERKQSDRAIRALNQELEDRVHERTRQLEAANQELEAFAYSAAHDLRAPLVTIDGFAQMLLEDYARDLPAEAQRFLQLVAAAARQMGALISDLLTFSRLSREALSERTVTPADIAREAAGTLNGTAQNPHAAVVVGDLPPCHADPRLLKQVFVNLLANALKFTRHREDATVEVGARPDPDDACRCVYFVRDNGVGFDMRYADKLFRVFQRLHSAEEYEGTGVGLAIVRRIVQRHGGRVWAEGEVGKGATVYFTLARGDGV